MSVGWMTEGLGEAKPYIETLVEINDGYRASLDALSERLEAQNGWDFEI